MINQPIIFDIADTLRTLRGMFVRYGVRPDTVNELCTLSIARALEDVFLASFYPKPNYLNNNLVQMAIINYRRCICDDCLTLSQDVGRIINKIESLEIPYDCNVRIQGDALVLLPPRAV